MGRDERVDSYFHFSEKCIFMSRFGAFVSLLFSECWMIEARFIQIRLAGLCEEKFLIIEN